MDSFALFIPTDGSEPAPSPSDEPALPLPGAGGADLPFAEPAPSPSEGGPDDEEAQGSAARTGSGRKHAAGRTRPAPRSAMAHG